MVTPCLPISRNRQYWPSWPPWILIFWESVPMAGELPWTESRCPTGRPFQMSRSSSVNGPICANSSSLANKILLPDTFCFKGFHFDAQLLNRQMKRHSRKVWCVFPMVAVSILPHAEFGPNDHCKDAPHLTKWKPPSMSIEKKLKSNWSSLQSFCHWPDLWHLNQFEWSYVVLNVAKNDKIKVFKFESKSTVANA